jgi:polyphosphate:AMP phosphotransferase
MFETAELGHRIEKAQYESEVPVLRSDLLEAQYTVLEKKAFPVIVIIGGVDGAGKGETVNLLNEWLDPRHVQVAAFAPPEPNESERPRLWRYWMRLPPRGSMGILFGSWYTDPIVGRVAGRTRRGEFDAAIEEIVRLERMLADGGALIVKFWFHLSKKEQKKRLEKLDRDANETWRVTRADWKQFERYDEYAEVSERALRLTSTESAPWRVVEAGDSRYREITVGRTLLEAMRERLSGAEKPPPPKLVDASNETPLVRSVEEETPLARMDLTSKVSEEEYDVELEKLQGRLGRLAKRAWSSKVSVVLAFEGMDAAGKGGAIRRVTAALDARQYDVVPIAAPTDEERAQPYLWRFWRRLPRHGHFTIFDRSWYGRVLVERVERFCGESDYERAYGEINDFEAQLAASDTVVLKFWLQTSKEEQLRRFEERESTRFKRFKITPEDWRNRDKWDAYQAAATDMIERTGTDLAPWHLVEAEDKLFARLKVLRIVVKSLEKALKPG